MEKVTSMRYPALLTLYNKTDRAIYFSGDLYITKPDTGKFGFLFVSDEGRNRQTGKPTFTEQVRRGFGYANEDAALDAAHEVGITIRQEVPEAV